MEPENEIVNWWLNRNGFFTIHSIKAPGNKEIGILALKLNEQMPLIKHIEVNCSVSYPSSLTLDTGTVENSVESYIMKKFNDNSISNTISASIIELVGEERPYQKAVVLGNIAQLNRKKIVKELTKNGINVINFSDVLCDVMKNLDKQNYQSSTIRNLQLVKHILMASPTQLSDLLNNSSSQNIFTQNTREEFLREFLTHPENQRIIQKELNEQILIDLLKKSSLKKPERLAKVISEDVLGARSGKKFVDFLEDIGVKKKEIPKKKEKPLFDFLKI